MLKNIIKRLFCKHKYQPIKRVSNLNKNNESYDTWYIFECPKCHKEKTLKTYGLDKILNTKSLSDYNNKEIIKNIEYFLRNTLIYDEMRDEYKKSLFDIIDGKEAEIAIKEYIKKVSEFYEDK